MGYVGSVTTVLHLVTLMGEGGKEIKILLCLLLIGFLLDLCVYIL